MIDIVLEDARWAEAGLQAMSEIAIAAALAHLGVVQDGLDVVVMGCDDARIADLNRDFRNKPSPTNVLSWPSQELTPPERPAFDPDGETSLGDIAIAYDTCARESVEQNKAFSAHVTHLLVHATLHLLGYDHQNDTDAMVMERLEVEILGKLGLPDPYF